MAEELDVSWFDLSNYDELASMDLSGWHTQIDVRNFISRLILKKSERDVLSIMKGLQKNPIWLFDNEVLGELMERYHSLSVYQFNTYSVFSTPAYLRWISRTSADESLQDIWNLCEEYDENEEYDAELDAAIYTPYDFICHQKVGVSVIPHANLTIDLTATDEQILSDFQHWLTEYRKATGYESNKNNFTDKDLNYWHELRLLPYIDLTLSAAIEGKKITQAKIANLIFSDYQHIDTVDKLRRTTKPKAEWLLRNETVSAIEAQLSSFKGK